MGKAVALERIERQILSIRGKKVMLDIDLATLYGVTTKVLNQAVKRHRERFPEDFMFQLTQQERKEVVTNCDHLQKLKFSPVLPHVFTEYGAIMLASVVNTQRAVEVSIYVVRAFVKLKEMYPARRKLARKLEELEHKLENRDEQIKAIFEAIRRLMASPGVPQRRIGFHARSFNRKGGKDVRASGRSKSGTDQQVRRGGLHQGLL